MELRAAAIMVSEGHARRVTLSGFTGPALVGEAARLSRLYGLSIDFAIRPDRRFDLVVSRGRALGG